MANASTPLRDVEQSVSRPLIFTILRQIFEITQLNEETQIYYAGKRGTMHTPGTTIDDANQRDALFATSNRAFIEVTEKYDLNAMQEIYTYAFENLPVFHDNAIRCTLRPIYTTSDVTISIQYRSSSETEVRRWMADMLIRTSRGRDLNLHNTKYTYSVPAEYVELLKDIWTLREAVAGYGDSFEDYLRTHSTTRLTELTTITGERRFAVHETQNGIQGFFDFVGVPDDPVLDKETGMWEIAFTYKFNYQRPDAMYVNFPLSVHNQLLPDKYLSHLGTVVDPLARPYYYSTTANALHFFSRDYDATVNHPDPTYLTLPEFDDFLPTRVLPGTATTLTALCFLGEDRQTLMNLTDLGDFALDADLLAYFKGEAPYMGKRYHSLVSVELYRDDEPMVDGTVEVLSDLTVRSKVPLDLRRIYHVRVSFLVEIHLGLQPALDRLAKYPRAFVKVVSAMNELLRSNAAFNALQYQQRLEPYMLRPVYWVLTGSGQRPQAPVPGSGARPWGKDTESFLEGLDFKTIQTYFQNKRRTCVTAMTTGIVVRKLPVNTPLKRA